MLEMLKLSCFDLYGNKVTLQKYFPCVAGAHIGKFAPKGLYSIRSYSRKENV